MKVRERVVGESDAAVSGVTSGEREGGLESKTDLLKVPSGGVFSGRHGSGADGRPNSSIVAAGVPERINDGLHAVSEFGIVSSGQPAHATAGELKGTIGLLEGPESVAEPVMGSTAGATAGERQRTIGLLERYESGFPPLSSSGCLSVNACGSLPAVPGVSARVCSVPSFSAAVANARLTPMHDAHNSCSGTVVNSLRVQRATSYNPEGVVAHNSRRKVRLNRTVGSRSVVQTVDMSPAPVAGTYRRSADKVHDQRQVSRKCLAESSRRGPGPGPGSGRRYGSGGGVSGLAAASLEIPCSLVMPPGRHQFSGRSSSGPYIGFLLISMDS